MRRNSIGCMKTFLGIILTVIIAMLAARQAAAQQACVASPAGPVSFWPGDGNASDIQDGNNGTLMNGATFGSGVIGNAFSFDGVDDFVSIPSSANLVPTAAVSVDLWAKIVSIPDEAAHLIDAKITGVPKPNGGIYGLFVLSNGRAGFGVAAGGGVQVVGFTNIVGDGRFHHLAGTWDGFEVRIYVDGIMEASAPAFGALVSGSEAEIIIGDHNPPFQSDPSNLRRVHGLLDEVKIYNRALSQGEIQGSAALVSWWDGDSVFGATACDLVHSNHGMLVNGASTAPGKIGNAFSFDGLDDFVQVPDSDLWAFGSNDFSINLWANFSTIDRGSREQLRNVFVAHDGAQPPFFTVNKWIFHYAENGLFFHIFDMREGIPIFLGPFPFAPVVGQFHHFAVTRSSSTYTFYADGVAIGSTVDSRPIPNAAAALTIGQSEGVGFFHGLIDEVQIYNRALSGEEIRNIFLAGAALDSTPPQISCGASDGAWHSGNVSIACTASDPESGLANPTDANFNLTTNVLAGTETANASTNTREVCNTVDGCATAGPISGNKVDRKAPTITVTSPVTNATYQLNASVAASYACTDSGSGVASCQGQVPNGIRIDTSSTGTKTFTVTSSDNVRNGSGMTVTYSVVSGGGGGATSADLGITLSAPSKASPGETLTYFITVANAGKVTATGVVVSDALPAGTVFASAAASQGTISSSPPVGSNGTVRVDLGSLANGARVDVRIDATVTATAGAVLTDTATVTATTQDLNSSNNSATQKTTVAKK